VERQKVYTCLTMDHGKGQKRNVHIRSKSIPSCNRDGGSYFCRRLALISTHDKYKPVIHYPVPGFILEFVVYSIYSCD